MGIRTTLPPGEGVVVYPVGFEWIVLVSPLFFLAIVAIVGYFVIKQAVLAALREHDRTREPR